MKNKILASLLAVCLFAGLAVPAFAATTSTVAGDGSKVTKMEFKKSSYDLKQDVAKNFAPELRVYESTKKLVIDYQQISWALEGQGTSFTIETNSTGVFVTALEKAGTATLIAKDDQSGKVVAKTTLKAVPNPAKGAATSFKYENQMNIQIPVGVTADGYAEDFTFKVLPISTGNEWVANNATTVANQVKADVEAALNLSGKTDGTKASFKIDLSKYNITGQPDNTTIVTLTVAGQPLVANALTLTTDDTAAEIAQKFNAKTVVIGGVTYTAVSTSGSPIITLTAGVINTKAPTGAVSASITSVDANGSLLIAGTPSLLAPVDGTPEVDKEVIAPAGPNGDNELIFTIKGDVLRSLSPDVTKVPVTTTATMTNKDGGNGKQITAKTNFTKVKAIAGKTIACVPNKTIEVGGTFDLADTVKVGASSANVQKKITNYSEEYYNENSEANDYAIVSADGTEVLGVAVGRNKIAVQLENGQIAYCTVNVVEKGTAPADATGTNTLVLSNWAPKIGVGETANIVVKATNGVTYTSLDTSIVTVDAAGKMTAVKEGTAKVKVQENDKDAVYVSVTVTTATTKPADKPSDVPQTSVVALAPLF